MQKTANDQNTNSENNDSFTPRVWIVLLVVGAGTLLSAMAESAAALALPVISSDLAISIDHAGWIMLSFLLSITVLLLAAQLS